jgi:hypothetical protein
MCILFLHTTNNPAPNEFRLILASNRDEYYERPAHQAHIWDDDATVIGGTARRLEYILDNVGCRVTLSLQSPNVLVLLQCFTFSTMFKDMNCSCPDVVFQTVEHLLTLPTKITVLCVMLSGHMVLIAEHCT